MSIADLPELSKLPKLLKEQQLKLSKFDLEYRPKSYFYPASLETKILAQIKGQERKKAILSFIKDNKRIPDTFFKEESLPSDIRNELSKVHPIFMGGEYLPDTEENEVEIARIVMKSATQDIFSIRAQMNDETINYSIIDENENEFQLAVISSINTFSLSEMINFIDHSTIIGSDPPDLYGGGRKWAFDNEKDLSAWDFETVQSDFYNELEPWYDLQNYIWLIEKRIDFGDDYKE